MIYDLEVTLNMNDIAEESVVFVSNERNVDVDEEEGDNTYDAFYISQSPFYIVVERKTTVDGVDTYHYDRHECNNYDVKPPKVELVCVRTLAMSV